MLTHTRAHTKPAVFYFKLERKKKLQVFFSSHWLDRELLWQFGCKHFLEHYHTLQAPCLSGSARLNAHFKRKKVLSQYIYLHFTTWRSRSCTFIQSQPAVKWWGVLNMLGGCSVYSQTGGFCRAVRGICAHSSWETDNGKVNKISESSQADIHCASPSRLSLLNNGCVWEFTVFFLKHFFI